jgi:hypothetical protein
MTVPSKTNPCCGIPNATTAGFVEFLSRHARRSFHTSPESSKDAPSPYLPSPQQIFGYDHQLTAVSL